MTTKEGRPRDAAISRALVRAAERRMESSGYGALTVDGLVNEVGTTRQTFYRRYSGIAMIALDVLLERFGGQELVDTGSLERDLLELQRIDVAMMSSPLIQKNLPGLLEEVRTDQTIRDIYLERLLLPRRRNVAAVLERARQRGDIGAVPDLDPERICDLLIGPLLARVVLPTSQPLDDRFARWTVDVVLRELRPATGRAMG